MPGHRNRWRVAFFVLLVVWIFSVLTLGYFIVDAGITQTYAGVSAEDSERALAVLERLVPAIQRRSDRTALLELLRAQNPRAFIVATDSTVEVDGLTFRFGVDRQLRSVGQR